MNKEIKEEFKIILSDLYDAGKQYGEELGYTKDDVLYEMRLNALAHSMIKLEAKLQQAYLQGAKDKLKEFCESLPSKHPYFVTAPTSSFTIAEIIKLAQQFLDSLTKENNQ